MRRVRQLVTARHWHQIDQQVPAFHSDLIARHAILLEAGLTREASQLRDLSISTQPQISCRAVVDVLAKGFGWRGKTYRTLSAVAVAITGTKWSGPKFFGLVSPTEKSAMKPISRELDPESRRDG